jgi:hypothetical protein
MRATIAKVCDLQNVVRCWRFSPPTNHMTEELDRGAQELALLQVERKAMMDYLVQKLRNQADAMLIGAIR